MAEIDAVVDVTSPIEITFEDSTLGTGNHSLLYNRDVADQHPISAITGLSTRLSGIEGNISTHSSSITSLDGRVDTLEDDVDALETKTSVGYLTAMGNSGNWKYRKWDNGFIEAWFAGSVSGSATTATGDIYRCEWTLAIPSEIGFTQNPIAIISGIAANTTIAHGCSATSTTSLSGMTFRSTSQSSGASYTVKIYAWGV